MEAKQPITPPIRVAVLTGSRWADFAAALAPEAAGGCWCSYFALASKEFSECTAKQRANRIKKRLKEAVPLGLVAYVEDVPMGWVAVAPKETLKRLETSRTAASLRDLSGVWVVTCFFIQPRFRGRGAEARLLSKAVDYAFDNGAESVAGLPITSDSAKLRADNRYYGDASTFLAGGFREFARPSPRRLVVLKDRQR